MKHPAASLRNCSRPRLVLIDDPQTTESAWSPSQCQRRSFRTPTEPEHLVRKAELDALAERFEQGVPAVFSPKIPAESMISGDTVETPGGQTGY